MIFPLKLVFYCWCIFSVGTATQLVILPPRHIPWIWKGVGILLLLYAMICVDLYLGGGGLSITLFQTGHSRPLVLYFGLFYEQIRVDRRSSKVAGGWIQTWRLSCRKQQLRPRRRCDRFSFSKMSVGRWAVRHENLPKAFSSCFEI